MSRAVASAGLVATEFGPLDPDTYKHQARLLLAQHCARPVMVHGVEGFIQTVSTCLVGGHVEMTVYLTGSAAPVDAADVVVPDRV